MTIFEELAEHSIRLRRIEAGHREQVLCPRCEGGRRREQSLTVTIDRDGMGAVWLCHRGSCGWNGSVRPAPQPNQDRPKAAPQPPRKPRAVKPEDQQRPDWLYDFFAERNIGARTVDRLGIYAAERRFPPPVGSSDAIVFPYVHEGEVVNRKYRPHPAKNPMMQEPGSLPTLYNADSINADHPLIWVEGEMDVAALVECGFEHVVTLKDGAPVEATFRENDARFTALATHADELKVIRSHVLAGDTDKPGHALREELARRLGRQKVLLVTWPDDCKDACDVLRLHGPEAVRVCIETAQPYPIDGLVRIKATTLIDLRGQPSPATMTTGVESIDAILKLPAEGRLIIITGYPSHGKAMALDTLVPTPNGWTVMGELQDGDEVYAVDGSITRVVKAHPVLLNRECYRVRFSGGDSFICDADHLWFTQTVAERMSERNAQANRGDRELTLPHGTDQRHKRSFPGPKTTREIRDTLKVDNGNKCNHRVPVAAPITGRHWSLDVRPYTLGAWLGDGTSESAGLTSADPGVPELIRAEGYEVRKNANPLSWYIHGLKGQLRDAGVLGNKHMPQVCLRASAEDRLALLQGLMDTDGYQGPDGVAEFCTTRLDLAFGVYELAATLGMKPNLHRGRATIDGRDCGEKYRICFVPRIQVFRLARKRDTKLWTERPGLRSGFRSIEAVDPVASQPVRCITVEHPSGLYLVGKDFIPTHNTTWVRFVMVNTAKDHNRKWLVFSPEHQPWQQFVAETAEALVGKPFYPMAGVESMSDDEIVKASGWLSDRVAMLVCDTEDKPPTLDWILERAEMAILRDGITDLHIDPWNELEHNRGDLSDTDYTGRCLQRCRGFGQRHGVNVWLTAHPAKPMPSKPGENRKIPDGYDISGSAHWNNKTDVGITVWAPRPGEAEIHLWKARFRRWGVRTAIGKADFDQTCGRYRQPIREIGGILA